MSSPTEFMRRVLPWPEPGETGWINLHVQFVPKDRQPNDPKPLPWTGRAFTNLSDFMGYAGWLNTKPNLFKNIFYCLSRQSEINGYSNGHPKVKRDADNAMFLKAVWLDVDVKPPPKGYASVDEAGAAVLQFCRAAGIPMPNAFVKSGGGLHCYWISDKPLTKEEWQPYAEGLKALAIKHGLRCDAGVTADAARVLRVPGTYNFKEATPREVTLHYLDPRDINFATAMAGVAATAPVVTATVTKPVTINMSGIVVPQWAKDKFDKDDNLANGIKAEVMLDFKLVERDCPFFKDAVATHGKDHSQPLWNLVALATTFFEDGEPLLHAMSNGYPTYTVEETSAMFARKKAEQQKHNLGWPSCAKIEGEGCTACAGCPLKGKIRSPLELGKVHPTPAPHVNASTSAASMALDLPNDGRYFVDEQGYICEQIALKTKAGEVPEVMSVRLFLCKITDPVPTADPDFGIDFTVTTDIATTKPVSLKLNDTHVLHRLTDALTRQGVKINPPYKTRLEDFFVNWIARLNEKVASMKQKSFGWVFDASGRRCGFCYGGSIYYDDGRVERAVLSDSVMRRQYSPIGKREPWLEAVKLITNQCRPEIEMIVASAFATPILFATGETGGSLGFWSESGTNKSTAVKIALAVWGHPKLTKLSPDSTERSLEQKLGIVNVLPAMIDDFQDHDQFARATKMLFMVTNENTRSRLTQNITVREQLEWKTMVIATANASFTDYMINTQKINSNAGLYRLLEITMPPIAANTPGRVYKDEAGSLLTALEHNFGVIGAEYAQWLVKNLDYVESTTRAKDREIAAKVGVKDGERFWVSAIAACLSGARFANEAFGTKFNLPDMEAAFIAQYMRNRQKMEEAHVEGHTEGALQNIIDAFLTRYHGNQLWTDNAPVQGGHGTVSWLKTPERVDIPVFVQWRIEDKKVNIVKSVFVDFLNEKKYTISSVNEGLRKLWRANLNKKFRIGSGTGWKMGPNTTIEIPIEKYHYLEATLYENSPKEKVPEHVGQVRPMAGVDVTATVTGTSSLDAALAAGQAQAARDLNTVSKAA